MQKYKVVRYGQWWYGILNTETNIMLRVGPNPNYNGPLDDKENKLLLFKSKEKAQEYIDNNLNFQNNLGENISKKQLAEGWKTFQYSDYDDEDVVTVALTDKRFSPINNEKQRESLRKNNVKIWANYLNGVVVEGKVGDIKNVCQECHIMSPSRIFESLSNTNAESLQLKEWQILKRGDLSEYKISDRELEKVRNREIVENMQDKKYIVFDHFNPDTLYFVKNIPDDSWIWDSDWIIEDVTDKHGNCLIENNDEYISVGEMGNKTLSDFDKEIIASLKQAIEEDPDEEYLCAYTSEDREFCFEKDELPDDLDSMTPFTDFVEDSYVDGDSNSQYQVINLDTEEFGEFGVDIFVDENEDLEESMRREMINENSITGTLPPSIDKFLMDMSQMYIDDLSYTDISKFGDRFTEDDIKQLKKYKTELSQGFEEDDPEIQEIFKNIKNIVKGNLQEAMTNKEKLMKRFPELNLNEDTEINDNKLNKQEVLDWLSEHELAWEDFINYFEDIYQSSAEVPIDEILGWISDHDNLAEDFEYKFGISVYADDCDDDCDWFEDELEEHVAIDVYNQLNSPNILEIKPSKLKESVEDKWNIGSNKLVSTDSQEFANLVDLAKLLQEKSPNKYQYTVEKTYEDFGAGMQWYNIICHDKKGDSWQVLNTKEWLDLANGNKSIEEMYQNVVTDRFFQDTVEKGSIFSMLDKLQ